MTDRGRNLQQEEYCTVIGGVNIDIGGRPDAKLIPEDSNPGRISYSLGGVGRNIAHNMSLLGMKVKLITALGQDDNARRIMESCDQLGIDYSDSLHTSLDPTSSYLFIAEEDGDMSVAISDMKIYRHLTPDYLQEKLELINNSSIVVLDANLPEESINYLLENCTAPIYVDPVSTTKAEKFQGQLARVHTIAPNRLEAEILSGQKILDKESLRAAAQALLSAGLQQVFITLGAEGLYACNRQEEMELPNLPCRLVNATGAGDAMMAGFVYGASKGYSLREIALLGLGAASIAVEGANTINENLSAEEIMKRAGL